MILLGISIVIFIIVVGMIMYANWPRQQGRQQGCNGCAGIPPCGGCGMGPGRCACSSPPSCQRCGNPQCGGCHGARY